MIFDIEAAELREGDHIVITQRIKRIEESPEHLEITFDDELTIYVKYNHTFIASNERITRRSIYE